MPSVWRTASSMAAFLLMHSSLAVESEWDCKNVRVDDKPYSLGELSGPKEVHWTRRDGPGVKNTTYNIDLCQPLKITDDLRCDEGSYVCGTERIYTDDLNGKVTNVITIAGDFIDDSSRRLKPSITALKGSSSDKDAKQGLTLEFHGGKHFRDGVETAQKAIIDLVCDLESKGTEGFDEVKREEELPDLDKDKKLKFVSYKEDDTGVLRLTWNTKFACEGQAENAPSKSSAWGFFTWFIVILFLLAAAYIVFGSWLNYQRYGSKGFDLIPHSDTIRDLPYIIKEWVDRLKSGGGSRGGYSAV